MSNLEVRQNQDPIFITALQTKARECWGRFAVATVLTLGAAGGALAYEVTSPTLAEAAASAPGNPNANPNSSKEPANSSSNSGKTEQVKTAQVEASQSRKPEDTGKAQEKQAQEKDPKAGLPLITENNDTNDNGTLNNVVDNGDNLHPSGKDRSVELGKSDSQGKARSDPDDNGRGPNRSNGGPDKPGGSGGIDKIQDGNNGCDKLDREDDNEGWCGKKPNKVVLKLPKKDEPEHLVKQKHEDRQPKQLGGQPQKEVDEDCPPKQLGGQPQEEVDQLMSTPRPVKQLPEPGIGQRPIPGVIEVALTRPIVPGSVAVAPKSEGLTPFELVDLPLPEEAGAVESQSLTGSTVSTPELLARTGGDLEGMVLTGLSMLGLGGVMYGSARRRRKSV